MTIMKLFKANESELEVTISNRTIFRIVGMTVLAIITFLAIKTSMSTLVLIGTAVFLALALNAPVHWLANRLPQRKGDNRKLATLISILVVLAALIGFIVAVVPPMLKQTASFISTVPTLISDARDENTAIGRFIARYNLQKQVDKLSDQLSDQLGEIGGSAIATIGTVGSSLFSFVTVIVLTIMMLLEGPRWIELAYRLIPARRRGHSRELSRKMLNVVQGYVNGQVTLAAVAAVLIVPIFFIMGVSYPIALMVLVFICGLIPMVGHTIGAIISTIIALFTSPLAAIVVLGYYILYQQIENYAVQPKIQSNSTNMSPLLVLIAVLLGANFGGLLGALVSIPVMGCIRILVLDYLERRDILAPVEASAVPAPAKLAKKTKSK